MTEDSFHDGIRRSYMTRANPLREVPNELRFEQASRLAGLYRDFYRRPDSRSISNDDAAKIWGEVSGGYASTKTKTAILQLKKLLEQSRELANPMARSQRRPTEENPQKEEVEDFLLDIFKGDPDITLNDRAGRLREIYTHIAFDVFEDHSLYRFGQKRPEKRRVTGMEIYFSNEPLEKAVEFFLIEPLLLPQLPEQRTS